MTMGMAWDVAVGWKALLTAEAARHALVASLTGHDAAASLEALRVLHVCTSFEPARKLLASHVKAHPAALHAVVAMASQVQSSFSSAAFPSNARRIPIALFSTAR
jgi:hypothetical protein